MKNTSRKTTTTIRQSKTLLEIIKDHQLKPGDIAKAMDISVSQIYHWNKKGILKTNPHYPTLKKLFPELQAKDTKAKNNGDEDLRSYNMRPKTSLELEDSNLPSYIEPKFRSTENPSIRFKDDWGLPYVPVEKRDKEWFEKRRNLPKKKGVKW